MSDNLGKFAMVIATLTAAVAVPAFSETVDAGRTISERFKTFDRNTVVAAFRPDSAQFSDIPPAGNGQDWR